jgi:hypothetical protein
MSLAAVQRALARAQPTQQSLDDDDVNLLDDDVDGNDDSTPSGCVRFGVNELDSRARVIQ